MANINTPSRPSTSTALHPILGPNSREVVGIPRDHSATYMVLGSTPQVAASSQITTPVPFQLQLHHAIVESSHSSGTPSQVRTTWWTLLHASKLTPLQITEMWNTSQTELESAILEFNNLNATPTTPNAKANYALTTRRARIVDLTASIQLLADPLEYCNEFASIDTQHSLLLTLARKTRLVTLWHLIMSRRQPQAAGLLCPHLAVKHTNTLYSATAFIRIC